MQRGLDHTGLFDHRWTTTTTGRNVYNISLLTLTLTKQQSLLVYIQFLYTVTVSSQVYEARNESPGLDGLSEGFGDLSKVFLESDETIAIAIHACICLLFLLICHGRVQHSHSPLELITIYVP